MILKFILIFLIQYVESDHANKILGRLNSILSHHNNENKSEIFNATNPYCSICCVDINRHYRGRQCGIHTMCAFGSKKISPACKGLIVMDFSRNEIEAIVDAHNTFRNRIAMGVEEHGYPGPQPAAANMRYISWDNELASVALRWATQCVYNHDRCRDLKRFPVGQNIARGNYASRNDLQFVADWFELVHFVNRDMIQKYDKKMFEGLSDYAQLVWADTYLIGCARVSFQEANKEGYIVYIEHFFCNYGPSGNIPEQSVYKIGEACTACPEGTFCTNPEYPGLCGSDILNETILQDKKRILKANKPVKLETNNINANASNIKRSLSYYILYSISFLLYNICMLFI
ncbi:unnamed protein product [Ceutorhynchus assimilis]|uniref:SCP domain-containing protein n=1 Tax=Ceutorhynchus assimilis TaxID=467358 RepID=A0A9N9QJQ8_9CUCU|nr:unnamed protein product [Ceutorhynchus assimilis]